MSLHDFLDKKNWKTGFYKFVFTALVGIGYWISMKLQEILDFYFLWSVLITFIILVILFIIYRNISEKAPSSDEYFTIFGNFVTGMALYVLKILIENFCSSSYTICIKFGLFFVLCIYTFEAICAYTYARILQNRREKA